ncbi:MAG: ABC transporter ATP-binding protein [Desulfuromonas sp.]|nr:ABC transporter ATP-binding protein [Desulfuromonas sp.]
MELIKARNVGFSYASQRVLHGIDFTLYAGDVVSLLGPNGSGKSTLLKILLGLYRSSGEVTLLGKKLQHYKQAELAQHIAYVPQSHNMPFTFTAFDVVLMGRLAYCGMFSNYSKVDRNLAHDALEKVAMSALADEPFSNLSGGQQQLVLIARALAQQAHILLMDEPVNGLDYGNQIRLLRLIKDFSSQGYTFLKTTHHPDHALYCSNRVALLKRGRMLACDGVERVLTAENIATLYGVEVEIMCTEQGERFCLPCGSASIDFKAVPAAMSAA